MGLAALAINQLLGPSGTRFALSRAGYFPRWLSRTNARKVPHWALVVPAVVGYGVILIVEQVAGARVKTGDLLMQIAVFAALISYVLMMVSHFVLRRRHRELRRAYRTPGYPLTPAIALVLSVVAMTSTLFYAEAATAVIVGTLAVFAVGIAYFGLYSRHHLVASAPEEEASLLQAAEAELED